MKRIRASLGLPITALAIVMALAARPASASSSPVSGVLPDWNAGGEAPGDRFGAAVASAGDVNGDGYADVLIGAPGSNGGAGNVSLLYLSGAGSLGTLPRWSAAGDATGDQFGAAVASAGDVNKDGFADVLVGGPGDLYAAGEVYLYLGGAGGLSTAPAWIAPGPPEGAAGGDEFGAAVASAGDVNGDGYPDIAVGAPGAGAPAAGTPGAGRVYVYLGGPTGFRDAPDWVGPAPADSDAPGAAPGDRFGAAVASAGDVNGDGYGDLLVSARGADAAAGKAYVYLGGPAGLDPKAAWNAAGEAAGDGFGSAIGSVGDANGDGFGDMVLAAPGHNDSTGKVYVYLGSAAGPEPQPSWTVEGKTPGDRFGSAIAGGADLNGDGFADVVVGAPGYENGAGMAAVVFLRPVRASSPLEVGLSAGRAEGEDGYGSSVALAASPRSGAPDIITGAPGYDQHTGAIYGYYGTSSDKNAPAAAPTVTPAPNSEGWNNGDVSVTWNWTDNASGWGTNPYTCSPVTRPDGEGVLTVSATCADLAGNPATVSQVVRVDRTPPSLSPRGPSFMSLNVPYTVTPNASDSLSGVASAGCDAPDTGTTGSKTLTCFAYDNAGNYASATVAYTVRNDPPKVGVVPGGSCLSDTAAYGTINLIVGDINTGASQLVMSLARNSNPDLAPNSGVVFGGSGANRTVTVKAAAGQSGTAVLTIGVSDGVSASLVPVTVLVAGRNVKTLSGTAGPDMLFGLAAAHTLNGRAGNDLLCGGAGNDTLNGGDGNDTLGGGGGDDVLNGQRGDDRLSGGPGADRFSGSVGVDSASDLSPKDGDTQDETVESH